jgi:hypothetical protein
MTETKHEKFCKLIEAAAKLYSVRLDEDTMDAYYKTLGHLSNEDFEYAIKKHTLDPRFGRKMFLPADIIKQLESRGNLGAASSGLTCRSVDQFGEVHNTSTPCNPCEAPGCRQVGSISPSITQGGPWFCGEHFSCES